MRRRTASEADELLDLYQRAATHLSVARSSAPDPELVGYLSWLIVRARRVAGESPPRGVRSAVDFLIADFPAALYRTRRWWIVTGLVNVVVALAMGAWFVANPGFEASTIPPDELRQLVDTDFESYYSEYAHASFAFRVWTNNAWVAAQCIAMGVLGLPVLQVLFVNVLNLAFVGSVMIRHGRGALFFGLITPHGLLELTAVFVAAAVGLRLFWAWVQPGPRPRLQALAEEGRAAVAVALGLVVVLLVSGAIEGFVTPSTLPTWARIGIGVLAEAAFLAYVFVLGRRAHDRGLTGDSADARIDTAPVRA